MKAKIFWVVGILLFSFGLAQPSGAQLLTNRSFDLVLEGDDPGQSFKFALPPDPLVPSVVHFDGSFQNLDASDTVVTYYLSWPLADGSRYEDIAPDWMGLPGSGSLPILIDQHIGWTPAEVNFVVEGGGPADHFRFAGEFTIQQVPEPGMAALLGAAAIAVLLRQVIRGKPRP